MAWVLEHSKAVLGTRLVALAIANHALPCGCNAYPSLRKIAAEAGVDKRTAMRAVQALVKLGELEVTARPTDRRAHAYRLKQVTNCHLVHNEIGDISSRIGDISSNRTLYRNRPNHRARAREALNGPCAVCCEPATAQHRGEWLCPRHWPLEAV